jgi:hypothetical protein
MAHQKSAVTLAAGLMLFGVGLHLYGAGARTHHSFLAEYDPATLMTFEGVVTEVEWTNPHARFYIDVTGPGGVENWNFELGSILILRRLGWRRDSLDIGDRVTVRGYLAKDGSRRANATEVTLPDGRSVFAGSSRETTP